MSERHFKSLDDYLPDEALVVDQIAIVTYLLPNDEAERLVIAHGSVPADKAIAMMEKAKMTLFINRFVLSEDDL